MSCDGRRKHALRQIAKELGLDTDHLNTVYAQARWRYKENPSELTDVQQNSNTGAAMYALREFEARGIAPPIHGQGPLPRNIAAQVGLAEVGREIVAQQLANTVESEGPGVYQVTFEDLDPDIRKIMGEQRQGWTGDVEYWDDRRGTLRQVVESGELDPDTQQRAEAALRKLDEAAQLNHLATLAGQFGDERALPALQAVVEAVPPYGPDNPNWNTSLDERQNALDAIVSIGGEQAEKTLFSLNQTGHLNNIDALRHIADANDGRPASPEVTAWATRFLDTELESIVDDKWDTERDNAATQQLHALNVLRGTTDSDAIEAIVRKAESPNDYHVGRRAILTLGTVPVSEGNQGQVRTPLHQLAGSKNAESWQRAAAARAIAESGDTPYHVSATIYTATDRNSSAVVREKMAANPDGPWQWGPDDIEGVQDVRAAIEVSGEQGVDAMLTASRYRTNRPGPGNQLIQQTIASTMTNPQRLMQGFASQYPGEAAFSAGVACRLPLDKFEKVSPKLSSMLRDKSISSTQKGAIITTLRGRVAQIRRAIDNNESVDPQDIIACQGIARSMRGLLRRPEGSEHATTIAQALVETENIANRMHTGGHVVPTTANASLGAVRAAIKQADRETAEALRQYVVQLAFIASAQS
jgi:hypothetical protein